MIFSLMKRITLCFSGISESMIGISILDDTGATMEDFSEGMIRRTTMGVRSILLSEVFL